MRIIEREAFLAMPAGTIFMKFGDGASDSETARGTFHELCIKAETDGNDFRYQPIHDESNCAGAADIVAMAEADPSLEVALDFSHTVRDAFCDRDQRFAVWSLIDVGRLITRLMQAAENASSVAAGKKS